MKSVYQHCSEWHLHRYLTEFDFRYSNCVALGVTDTERWEAKLAGVSPINNLVQREGKRRGWAKIWDLGFA